MDTTHSLKRTKVNLSNSSYAIHEGALLSHTNFFGEIITLSTLSVLFSVAHAIHPQPTQIVWQSRGGNQSR